MRVEQEVGGDASDAAMFGLAHGAMLLAASENALDHRPARLRHAIALRPGRFVTSEVALLGSCGFGDGAGSVSHGRHRPMAPKDWRH